MTATRPELNEEISFAPPARCPIILYFGGSDRQSREGRALERLGYRGLYWTAEVGPLGESAFDLSPLTLAAFPVGTGSIFNLNLYTFGASSRTYHTSMTPPEAQLTAAVRSAIASGEKLLVIHDGPLAAFLHSRIALETEMATAVLDQLIERAGLTPNDL